jgi:ferredoxin-type protein NapG
MTASFAAVTSLAGLTDLVPSRSLVRPPGALNEDRFLESCIRCGSCADVCPVRGIGIAHITDGLRNVGTPVLSGYCMVFRGLENPSPSKSSVWKHDIRGNDEEVACLDCVNVCPTGALQQVTADQFRMGTAVVDKDHCLAYVNGSCGYPCASVCPFDAISINHAPVVDETKCAGCGQCDLVCLARLKGPSGITVRPRQP